MITKDLCVLCDNETRNGLLLCAECGEKYSSKGDRVMYEMTLKGLLRLGNSHYVKNDANYMVIFVEVEGSEPEIIINPKKNFESKLAYYQKAYNDDLSLKVNPKIKIIRFDFVESISDYFIS